MGMHCYIFIPNLTTSFCGCSSPLHCTPFEVDSFCNSANARLKHLMRLTTCARGDECFFLKDALIVGQCLLLVTLKLLIINNTNSFLLHEQLIGSILNSCSRVTRAIYRYKHINTCFESICKENIFVNMYKAIKMCLFANSSSIHIHSFRRGRM